MQGKQKTMKNNIVHGLMAGAAVSAIAAGAAQAQSISDEIVVTAQRTEQSLQDVPIAVSAFGGDELLDRQLESFTDIQFNIPNFSFSRTQFTGSSISLRGVGALATGATTEPSVSIHINEVFISAPRLFETEFYDIERLEILRGPQGTLFGRNATGGVINVITAKASSDEVSGYIDGEFGNYQSVKVQGALNVPITDTLATRIAGTIIQRDGFTENLFDGSDIDDRNIFSMRSSTRWLPTENTTVDFTATYTREDDSRSRSQKQACAEGPLKPFVGCQPGAPLDFTSSADLRATFGANASAEALGLLTGDPNVGAAFGLYSLTQDLSGEPQPADLRQVNQDFRPQYDSEETIFLLNAKHDFETFSVKLNAGWGNSKIATRNDFDGGVGPTFTSPPGLAGVPALAALYANNDFRISDFDVGIEGPNGGRTGIIGGFRQGTPTNRFQSIDLSIGETDYWSVEGIVTTSFDGPLNFLFGTNYSESSGFADYAVATTGLDYFSVVLGTLQTQAAAGADAAAAAQAAAISGGITDPAVIGAQAQAAADAAVAAVGQQGFSLYVPYFFNDSEDVFTNALGFFGEVYWDISDTLRFTGGVRHNRDDKGSRERETLLASLASATAPVVPLGTQDLNPILDPDPFTEGTPGVVGDFVVNEGDFNATTGRAVLQWTPTDNAQFYASYSRGYKPGGFNPRSASVTLAPTFDEENINAYEIGVKSNLFDNTLQANITGFYYDYSGLQISRFISNSVINDNVDATIWGVEGEFVYRPTDALTFNMNASYLNTEIGDFSDIDPRNPSQLLPEHDVYADITNGSNCVVNNNGAPSLIGQTFAGPLAAANALVASPFTVCSELAGLVDTLNTATGSAYEFIPTGVVADATGNELPGSPEFQISGGVQYEFRFGQYLLTPRVDAYYQSDSTASIFNTATDLIPSYSYFNGQIRFEPEEGNWYIRAFMQNITDEDAITGTFPGGQGAGNYTNVFLLEPNRWGFGIGYNF